MHATQRICARFALILFLTATLAGCGGAQPAVYVVTAPEGSGSAAEYAYYAIGSGRAKNTERFTPDVVERYDALHDNFSATIERNTVVNHLRGTLVTDADGKAVSAEGVLSDILTAAAETIQHEMICLDILKDGDSYFAVVKLNVNWWSPCELYRYDTTTKKLSRLCSWDSTDIVGIALAPV